MLSAGRRCGETSALYESCQLKQSECRPLLLVLCWLHSPVWNIVQEAQAAARDPADVAAEKAEQLSADAHAKEKQAAQL